MGSSGTGKIQLDIAVCLLGMEMFDIVGIGALNIDYIATRSNLQKISQESIRELASKFEHGAERPGTPSEVQSILSKMRSVFTPSLGGSAFNVIQAIASTDPAIRLGYIGITAPSTEPSIDFMAWLRRHNVDHTYIQEIANEIPGICISYIEDGERQLITTPGVNIKFGQFIRENKEMLLEYLSRTRIIHVTSFFDDDTPMHLAELLEEAKRRNPGLKISFDPGHHWAKSPNEHVAQIFRVADYLFLNDREFRAVGHGSYGDNDFTIARNIFDLVSSRTVVVLLKRYDRIILFFKIDWRILSYEIKNRVLPSEEIEDATGAGDVFAAGFLAARLYPVIDLRDAVEFGLRLVREKLRFAGTNSFHTFRSIFEDFVSELFASEEMRHPRAQSPIRQPQDKNTDVSQPGRDHVPADSSKREMEICHEHVKMSFSPGYRSLLVSSKGDGADWVEHSYSFTGTQGAIFKALLGYWEKGTPDVDLEHLKEMCGFQSDRVDSIFQGNEAWGPIIGRGKRKSTFRIAFDTPLEFKKRGRT